MSALLVTPTAIAAPEVAWAGWCATSVDDWLRRSRCSGRGRAAGAGASDLGRPRRWLALGCWLPAPWLRALLARTQAGFRLHVEAPWLETMLAGLEDLRLKRIAVWWIGAAPLVRGAPEARRKDARGQGLPLGAYWIALQHGGLRRRLRTRSRGADLCTPNGNAPVAGKPNRLARALRPLPGSGDSRAAATAQWRSSCQHVTFGWHQARHCERSEAIQRTSGLDDPWMGACVAALLAMTIPISRYKLPRGCATPGREKSGKSGSLQRSWPPMSSGSAVDHWRRRRSHFGPAPALRSDLIDLIIAVQIGARLQAYRRWGAGRVSQRGRCGAPRHRSAKRHGRTQRRRTP